MSGRRNKGARLAGDPERRRALRQKLYERDNWICWICGNRVEPENASLDHVIPQSEGGTSKQSNLRLAHMRCNLKRGNLRLKKQKEAPVQRGAASEAEAIARASW